MVRVAQINPHLDSLGRPPWQLLRDWPTLVRCASAASQAGVRVTVLQRCEQREHLVAPGEHLGGRVGRHVEFRRGDGVEDIGHGGSER